MKSEQSMNCCQHPSGNVRNARLCLILVALLLISPLTALPRPVARSFGLPLARPSAVGMSARHLAHIDAVVNDAIKRGETPGAVVLVGRNNRIAWRKAYGHRALLPSRETLTTNTIFDLASLTKVVATATSIMVLVERGKVRLRDSIAVYIPELGSTDAGKITIEQLLTHTSGYAPDFDLRERWIGLEAALEQLYKEPLRQAPGTRFIYSDIGYITLGEVVRRASGQPLDEFARRSIFAPLRMRDTGFAPDVNRRAVLNRIAPTETVRGQASYLGGRPTNQSGEERVLRGSVHDPTAARMNGVAGHAGLFSTANDLAIYCQMILNGGTYRGVRVLSPLSIETMTRPRGIQTSSANPNLMARGLGWDITSPYSSNRGDLFPLGSFGHTGFTGTSLWLDPTSRTFLVFLSNRVHPDGKGDVTALRGRIATIVAASVTDTKTEDARTSVAHYSAELLASNSAWLMNALSAQAAANQAANQTSATTTTGSGAERQNVAAPLNAEVLTGIDVLERSNFKPLQNLRIGLITNHTGRNRKGESTIDVLHRAANAGVRLTTLFSPEHGIRGQLDEEGIKDSRDERTGLPIYSLYGETRRPRPEQLKDLDALVYDIQDVGARFYTYSSTLGLAMEAAAEAKIPIFVLDRPNPINGINVEGPIADKDKLSFTAYHEVPVRHGMTFGELARLYNKERNINCDLRVVEMQNWQRAMWYDETNLLWVNPSPNMRSLTEATLYPGVGLLEFTNLSVGRGTDTPFEVIGAPWLDGQKLAKELNARGLPGVRFVPLKFTPRASRFKDEECGGINLIVTDRASFESVFVGLEIAAALRRLFPIEWKIDNYTRLLADAETMQALTNGRSAEEMRRLWASGLDEFKARRASALIYK